MRQFELVERVKTYDPGADEEALNKAYVFSLKAHGSQRRASGDPYFSHPLEVAGILTEYRLDTASIVTGLLHDTVEDTVATLGQIETLFGEDVARLVDGVTKLSKLELQSDDTKQAENFRKLLLATSEDIRVLLVKLADRLHNMRTLSFIKSEDKRRRIARETMEIYSPLAERMGMQRMKDELEDLAFADLHPDAFKSITRRLAFLRETGEDVVPTIVAELEKTLADGGLTAAVSGREKRPFSIWRKMKRKNVEFERLSDIMAFRVLVDSVEDCYRALGLIHTTYASIPDQFDDYISTPKPNGYRSLHTAVIGPGQMRVEVQIRTHQMHDIADLGVAAHWRYKQDGEPVDGRQYRWLRELLDILDHAAGPEEFLEHTKLEMFQDEVFCFTPKGELINLPRGATPIDFAYAVHSEVGDRCVSAKINGRIVPLRTQLKNGDQVEIVTSDTGTPSPTWEDAVVTGKARAQIRRFVRSAHRNEFARLGAAILERTFSNAGFHLTEEALDAVLPNFNAKTIPDLQVAVGQGRLSGAQVLHAIAPGAETEGKAGNGAHAPPALEDGAADLAAIPIRGLIPGMAVHYADCCHPMPGDRIVGIVDPGRGVMVHTAECETLESFHDTPERWLDVAWELGPDDGATHVGRIKVVVANERGTLGNLSTVIAQNLGNIHNLKFTNRSIDFYEMIVDIEVADSTHLSEIIAALRATPNVNSVERAPS